MRAGLLSRGATLLEVVVYSGVLLMLLGSLYFVVNGGMRQLRLADAGQTVNQQAVIGLRRVIHEMSPASQASLDVDTVPQEHVTFLSPDPPEGDPPGYTFVGPSMEWKKWVSLFQDGDSLVKVENELGTYVTDPGTLPTPDFPSTVLGWPRRKAIAGKVAELRFVLVNPAVVRVEVVTQVETGTGKTTDMQLISSVRLLNE